MTFDLAASTALLTAMQTRVEEVELYYDVRLDASVLTQYDGHGKCRKVRCYDERYHDTLHNWAGQVGWKSKKDGSWLIVSKLQ